MRTMTKPAAIAGLALALAVWPSTFGWEAARAGSCFGTVRGLSANYNKARGTGFLAVRSRGSSKSRQIGELFNGDEVELYDKRRGWYQVDFNGRDGWVFGKYIRAGCADPRNP